MKKTLTAVALILVLILCIVLRDVSNRFFDLFIGLVMILSSYEVSNIFSKMGFKINRTVSMIYPVVVYLGIVISINNAHTLVYFFLTQLIVFISSMMACYLFEILYPLLKNKKAKNKAKIDFNKAIKTTMHTVFALVYPTMLLSLFFVLNNFNHINAVATESSYSVIDIGLLGIVLVFVISSCTDTFAQLVGNTFKGPKLCPMISPNKTISGAIGGFLFGVLSSLVIYLVLTANDAIYALFLTKNITPFVFLAIGMVGSLANQAGDILASFIKRKAGVKDFSNILYSHGGIMDRFNGISFNCVVVTVSICIMFLI